MESNTYDSYSGYSLLYPANRTGLPGNDPRQHDNANFGQTFYWRGNPTYRLRSGVGLYWVSQGFASSVEASNRSRSRPRCR